MRKTHGDGRSRASRATQSDDRFMFGFIHYTITCVPCAPSPDTGVAPLQSCRRSLIAQRPSGGERETNLVAELVPAWPADRQIMIAIIQTDEIERRKNDIFMSEFGILSKSYTRFDLTRLFGGHSVYWRSFR